MKKYFELYNPNKIYYSPIGEEFTPEVVGMKYSIVNSGVPCLIETDKAHIRFYAICTLEEGKDMFGVEDTLEGQDAILAIEEVANAPLPAPEPTTEERIASALEAQVMLSLPDSI